MFRSCQPVTLSRMDFEPTMRTELNSSVRRELLWLSSNRKDVEDISVDYIPEIGVIKFAAVVGALLLAGISCRAQPLVVCADPQNARLSLIARRLALRTGSPK